MHCMMVSKISKHLILLFNTYDHGCLYASGDISKHLMLLFNSKRRCRLSGFWRFQNISCYCLTARTMKEAGIKALFQNISCYCLTNEKSLFLNRFFTKKNDFISFFNIFTNPLTNFNLSWKTTYSSRFYYFFKKSLGKISKTSFPHVS